jgi:hypothetical protein
MVMVLVSNNVIDLKKVLQRRGGYKEDLWEKEKEVVDEFLWRMGFGDEPRDLGMGVMVMELEERKIVMYIRGDFSLLQFLLHAMFCILI